MRGVETSAHCGAALRQFVNGGQGMSNRLFGDIQLGHEGRQLLAKGHGGCIHHVGAPGFNQLTIACRLFSDAARQLGDGGQQIVLDCSRNGDVHGGGEAIVGALCAVDVVVGVHRALAATCSAGQFIGAPGNDLVDVHVALGAAARLPDHQRKLIVVLAVEYFVGGLFDQTCDVRR